MAVKSTAQWTILHSHPLHAVKSQVAQHPKTNGWIWSVNNTTNTYHQQRMGQKLVLLTPAIHPASNRDLRFDPQQTQQYRPHPAEFKGPYRRRQLDTVISQMTTIHLTDRRLFLRLPNIIITLLIHFKQPCI